MALVQIRKKTILLVEDEAVIALTEKNLLNEFGYEVLVSYTGEESVEIFRNDDSIDLVLMDIDLGDGIDGTEAAKIILEERDVPIVFLSSHIDPETVEKTEKITSYGYITKNSGGTVINASIKMAFKLFSANRKIKNELMERKKLERILDENEVRYQTLFKSMSQGFYVSDIIYDEKGDPVDFRYVDVNSAFEQILGLKREEIIGKTYNDLVPPDPASGWIDCFKRVATTGKPENYTFPSKIYNCYFETYAFIPREGKFAALVKDITERILAEEKIKYLLNEKEIIIEEVHHRIKNNMNLIFSLLKLQSEAQMNTEAKKTLIDAANRIQSMKALYDKFYFSENRSSLSVKVYLPPLINEVVSIFPSQKNININTEFDAIVFDENILFSIGLIINELITNAMKFAFTGRDKGTITISLRKKENINILTIIDNGVGLPPEVSIENSPGFGMQLVGMLLKQINGSIKIERQDGTMYTIEFKG